MAGHGRSLRLEFRVRDVDLLPVRDEGLARGLFPGCSVLRPIELERNPPA